MTQKQRQRNRPPTASEAREWYSDGWIGEDGLEELLESAIEHYGDAGDQEFVEVAGGIETTEAKAEEIETLRARSNKEHVTPFSRDDFMFVLAVGFVFGVIMTIAVFMAFPEFTADFFNIGERQTIPLTVF